MRFQQDGKWGYKIKNHVVIEPQFSKAEPFRDKITTVKIGDLVAIINYDGQIIYEFEDKSKVNDISPFGDNQFKISIEKRKYTFEGKSYYGHNMFDIEYFNFVGVIDYHGEIVIPFDFENIGEILNGKAKAKKNGKWGYINEEGTEVIPIIYTRINSFIDGIALAVKDGGIGAINEDGLHILPFKYDRIHKTSNDKAIGKINGKEGYFEFKKDGKVLIPFEYDEIEEFIDGKAKAKKNGNWGFINELGNEIIPLKYDEIEEFIDGKAKAKKNGNWGFINELGNEIILFEYDEIQEFIDGKAKVKKDGYSGKWGYIDVLGDNFIPCEYDEIQEFIDGRVKAKKNEKWGSIDEKGNEILPCEFDWIQDFVDGKAKAKKNNKQGYIDEIGNTIIPFEYDEIEEFIEGKAKVKSDGKFGFINSEGCVIVPCIYDLINKFNESLAFAKKNNLWGRIDEFGNEIICFEYSEIYKPIDGKSKAKKNGKIGFIDSSGRELFEDVISIKDNIFKAKKFEKWSLINENHEQLTLDQYDEIQDFVDGKAKVQKDKKWGLLGESGKELISCEYDGIRYFIDGKAKAIKNNKWGYLDEQGNVIIPFKYDVIQDFVDGKAKAKENRKWGYIDEIGNAIIPFDFDVIHDFIDGVAKANKNGRWGYIDENGHWEETLKIGNKFTGTITGITDFGLFINIDDTVTGLLHKSRFGYNNFSYNPGNYNKGQKIEVVIDKIDPIMDRISLTFPKKEDYWSSLKIKDSIGQILDGKIIDIKPFGLIVEIQVGVTGLVHISKLSKDEEYTINLTARYKAGDIVTVFIESINLKEKKIDLGYLPFRDPFEDLMIFVHGGTFMMGSDDGEECEKPIHEVVVSDFYIGKYLVTQTQWKLIMGTNPSTFMGDDLPVENVSWCEAHTFIQKLNEKTGSEYRLPTEAEWEFAAKGGKKSKGYKYAGSNMIDEVAWIEQNSGGKTHSVGQKKPNELGICDMTGNLMEWCYDFYSSDYYQTSPEQNPLGPNTGSYHVYRGGSWYVSEDYCNVTLRRYGTPGAKSNFLGFRLLRTV